MVHRLPVLRVSRPVSRPGRGSQRPGWVWPAQHLEKTRLPWETLCWCSFCWLSSFVFAVGRPVVAFVSDERGTCPVRARGTHSLFGSRELLGLEALLFVSHGEVSQTEWRSGEVGRKWERESWSGRNGQLSPSCARANAGVPDSWTVPLHIDSLQGILQNILAVYDDIQCMIQIIIFM